MNFAALHVERHGRHIPKGTADGVDDGGSVAEVDIAKKIHVVHRATRLKMDNHLRQAALGDHVRYIGKLMQ